MFRPFAKAKPAKLVRTHFAVHMVTALILLNRFATLWTLFSVCHDPSYVFTLSRVLRLPKISNLAITRPMRFLATSETEWISAFAVYIWLSRISVFNAVIAPLVRTPTYILVIISVSFTVPLHVSLEIFAFEIFQKHRMRYHDITHVLRAFAVDTLESIIYSLL